MDKREAFNSRIKPKYIATHVPQCKKCMYFAPWGENKMHVHHIVCLCDGGNNDDDNLTVLCTDCHREWHECFEDRMEFSDWLQKAPSKVYASLSLVNDDLRSEYCQNIECVWPTVKDDRMTAQPFKDARCRKYTKENCVNWIDW